MDQYLREAVELIQEGQCEDGLTKLGQILPENLTDQDEIDYLFWKGTALAHLSQFEAAERVLRAAVRRYGMEGRFHLALGQLLSEAGREEESLPYFARAGQLLPRDFLNAYEWGYALYKLERDDEAIFHFQEALSRQPKCRGAVQYLGDIYLHRGELAQALSLFESYLAQAPTDGPVLVESGICLSDLGRFEEAFERYRRAIRHHPGYMYAYYNWSVSLWRAGRIEEALRRARQCLAADRACALAWMLLGRLEIAQGRQAPGLQHLERGLALARSPGQDDFEIISWCYEAYFEAMIDLQRLEDAEAVFWEAARGNLLTQSMLVRHNLLFAEETEGLCLWSVLLDVQLFEPVPVKELEGECAAGYLCGYEVLAPNPDAAVDFAMEFERQRGEGEAVAEEILLKEQPLTGVPGVAEVHHDREYYSARPELSR